MPQLIFTTPHFNNQSFKLPEGKTTVGRVAGNTLVIQHDTISANHCEILLYGREVIVRDRGSTNGTWVDDCRVKGPGCATASASASALSRRGSNSHQTASKSNIPK